ncbi:hypothetical protein ACS0TY_026437 [Phlomoides rotata]
MAGEAVSATIGVLVQNLIDCIKDEISLIRGLEDDANNLKLTLTRIQGFLDDAGKKFITDNAAVKTWLNELEAVAFDADNILDELNYQRLSKEMKSIHPKKKEVPSCFPCFKQCVLRRDMADRIRKLNTNFESINTSATALGLVNELAQAPAAAPAASETDSFTVDPIFIGRDHQVSEIVEMLTTPTEEAVSILPIVGMGGLGKTTLARKVFHHEKTKTHFQQHIWVHVSQHFDEMVLFKKILLKVGNVEDESRYGLLKKLQEALGNKTYLLVLDDIWNKNQVKWDGFINSLSGISSTRRNAILVTTRITEVASIVRTLAIHHLNGLSEEECWSIIKGKALKGGDIPPGLESIGTRIAARCQGLPLAANVVGGMLRDKSYDEWLSIKENWLSADNVEGDENNITKILKLSVHHLSSSSLKKCFAYCSIFPKGDRIEMQKLIELWMAEGFLPTNDMENVGNQFFNILLQNSLLQAVDTDDYGNVRHCSMHDLVHDVAASVLGFPVNDEGSYRPRYILWEDESSRIPKEQAKLLRTLIYNCRISDLVFSDFKSLHSLIITGFGLQELPASIRELIHLRSLDISITDITRLPESIGELYHLQTLRTCSNLKLPSTLKYLCNLRHLHVDEYTKLPPHLGMLTSLQTLSYFKVGDEEGHRIEELGSLKHLKGELKIGNLENVQGEEESTKAHLSRKSGIVKLVLEWDGSREGEINDENVLKGLQPHPNVKMLKISGYRGARFPSWTLKMAVCLEGRWVQLHNLVEIRLESCDECEEIPTLGQLPRLESLYLYRLKNVKSIGSSFYGVDNCSSKETVCVFPALERLELKDMGNFREWEGFEIPSDAQVKVFPHLKYLVFENCPQLTNICGTKFTSLENLIIEEMHELACLPDWLFHNNQSLSLLTIRGCPKLKELPDGIQTLNSLQDLRLRECPNLKSIPYSSSSQQGFTLLRRLSIKLCPELMNYLREMMFSDEKLELRGMIMNMTEKMECLPKMSRLTELQIGIIPHVMIFTSPAAASLPNFHNLTINYRNYEYVSAGDSVSSVSEVADGILRLRSHSLSELRLNAQKAYSESLPDQLQHLTALVQLDLSHFGIEELPEWFGNLSSLQTLTLYDCSKLKHLASVEAMRRLTKLTFFRIYSCPLLRIDYNDDSSEWTKISHVPDILYGSRFIQRYGGLQED